MIRIAVVEDEPGYSRLLNQFITDYECESGEAFYVANFYDGLDLIENYTSSFDIIFMDIEMKHLDGMSAARQIRQQDRNVIIVFITNLAKFAIQGYQVEAMNYILKPIHYFAFSQELKKAIEKVRERSAFFLHIAYQRNMIRLDVSRISYVESIGHSVTYHVEDGDFTNRDSLKNVEEKLQGHHFSRCNNCYLVNLAYVEKVDKNIVTVSGKELQISRPRKKAFMEALAVYVGGN